ncbi:ALKBH3, partial [Symbiodinium microadriaticum]
LQQQITTLKGEKTSLQQQILGLQRRIQEIEEQAAQECTTLWTLCEMVGLMVGTSFASNDAWNGVPWRAVSGAWLLSSANASRADSKTSMSDDDLVQVGKALSSLKDNERFHGVLQQPSVSKAVRHWAGIERLSPEECEDWQSDGQIMFVLAELRRLEHCCRKAGMKDRPSAASDNPGDKVEDPPSKRQRTEEGAATRAPDCKSIDPATRTWQHDEPAPAKLAGEDWEEHRSKVGLQLMGEMPSANASLNYFLKDESRRSFAAHLANPFGQQFCASWFAKVRVGTKWLQPNSWWGPMPRKTAWMVAKGHTCTYEYGGMEVQPIEYPVWMVELMQSVMPHCGLTEIKDMPNSCNLNLYEDGKQMVGWHADDEELFQGKSKDCRIISLSLGASRQFELELNWPGPDESIGVVQTLSDGDICTMEGMTQKHFMHRVPEEETPVGPRINLTWRWIAKPRDSSKKQEEKVPLHTVLACEDELPLPDGRRLRGGKLENAAVQSTLEDLPDLPPVDPGAWRRTLVWQLVTMVLAAVLARVGVWYQEDEFAKLAMNATSGVNDAEL